MSFSIRDFDPSRDKPAALSFIMGSQLYEREVEPDRRVDPQVAEDYFPVLMAEVALKHGRVFIAESEGEAIGWAAITVEESPLFVVEEERTYGYITELFVDEKCRGLGAGQALIEACENEARRLGLGHVLIGLLTQNARTANVYRQAGYSPYISELRKYL